MPTHTNNRIVFDFKKVAYVSHYWSNGKGNHRILKPRKITYNGHVMDTPDDLAVHHDSYPGETNIARLKRLGMIDVWIPVTRLQFANTHSLEYHGAKALSIWKEWCARQFGRKGKK